MKKLFLTSWLRAALVTGVIFAFADRGVASDFESPDILVLGDSQISFGSGPAFVDFMENLEVNCEPNRREKQLLNVLDTSNVGVIGVRSTSLHSWTARSGAAKGSVCDIDPKWKVNAGTYGVVNKTENQFKQMGQGRNYQFCKKGQSPFEAMFEPSYYAPKLLVLTFLGNSTKRWQTEPELTKRDVQLMAKQLPSDIPCVFMTTAPAYKPSISDRRFKAQTNIRKAMKQSGNRCVFVDGLTEATMAANHGNKSFFRLNKSGGVKDPYHPNKRGARQHLELIAPQLCEAIFTALDGKRPKS